MNKKTDLTQYSDDELTLEVFNNELLYTCRHQSSLFDYLSEWYVYTEEQLEQLKKDLQDDWNELHS